MTPRLGIEELVIPLLGVWVLVLPVAEAGRSAATLTRPAFGTHTAGARPDHFFAAAHRADNVHEHAAERFLHPIGMAVAVHPDRPLAGRRADHDIDQVLVRVL